MTIREKAYVTFTFQARTVILPSMFEASVSAMASGNVFDLVHELVPNPDELLNDMTMTEFGDFVAAWSKASEEARPKPQPNRGERLYERSWSIYWLIVCAATFVVSIASIFIDIPLALLYTLIGMSLARLLHLFCAPRRKP